MTELNITIITESDVGPIYRAGSPLILTCSVQGGWESTCGGDCFVQGQTSSYLRQETLQSTDAGSLDCYVEDYVGHTADASIKAQYPHTGIWPPL